MRPAAEPNASSNSEYSGISERFFGAPKMQAFHARNLTLSRKMAINLQSFGRED
jgi:hypothetical protein